MLKLEFFWIFNQVRRVILFMISKPIVLMFHKILYFMEPFFLKFLFIIMMKTYHKWYHLPHLQYSDVVDIISHNQHSDTLNDILETIYSIS